VNIEHGCGLRADVRCDAKRRVAERCGAGRCDAMHGGVIVF
jgi:hypothetical protein